MNTALSEDPADHVSCDPAHCWFAEREAKASVAKASDQRPSVGRVVHYVSFGTPGGEFTSQCRAAIVTEVQPRLAGSRAVIDVERVGLAVLNPTGIFLHSIETGGCRQSEDEHVGGTWHWPERV